MPLVTGKLEDFLWTTKTCSNLNSSYNYIKKFCFELSFLTFIPCSPEHENAYNNNNNNILLIQSWSHRGQLHKYNNYDQYNLRNC